MIKKAIQSHRVQQPQPGSAAVPSPLASASIALCLLAASAQPVLASPTLTVLHSFTGTDGANPSATLALGTDGNFYGTTSYGGAPGYSSGGTVFKMTPDGVFTSLHSFLGPDGYVPNSALIQAADGNFYGTTTWGGAYGGGFNDGVVFKLTPDGVVTTVYSFAGSDGANPYASLLQDSNGNFYGTTSAGGELGGTPSNNGTVFEVTPTGTVTTLHSFNGGDGNYPQSGLLLGADGNFYGMTAAGGAFNYGTVFKLAPDGTLTTLHSFNGSDGNFPYGNLVPGKDGNYYGATDSGGTYGYGNVFKMTPDGTVTNVCSLNFTNGAYADSGILQGSDGNFYGSTWSGGAFNKGVVFQCTPGGTLTTLYSFSGADGFIAYGGLIEGAGGALYGTTLNGGANNWGEVFKLSGAIAPGTPTSLTATHGNHTVTLSWTAASAAATYSVYGGKTPGGESSTPIKTGVTGTTVTITGLRDGTTYYFKVATVNDAGASALSNEARAMPRRN